MSTHRTLLPTSLIGSIAACVLFLWPLAARAADILATVTLPDAARAYAANPETGVVAIIDGNGALSFYPGLLGEGTLDGAIKDTSGGTFDAIVHKRVTGGKGYFVAGSATAKNLQIFDDRSFKSVKTIPVTGNSNTIGLAASLIDRDPYVLCSCSGAHRINLLTLSDQGKIAVGSGNDLFESPDEIAVSADGSLLYGRKTQVSPSGVRCWKIQPAPGAAGGFIGIIRHSEHNTRPMYVPDSLGQFVACGKTLFTADMTKVVSELSVAPVWFHPSRPFVFGYENGTLSALSLNTFKEVASVAIKGEDVLPGPGRHFNRGQFRLGRGFAVVPTILTDNKRHNLLVCFEKSLVVVSESGLNLPDEPFLSVSVDAPDALIVGRAAQVQFVKQDPRVRIELASGPTGVQLTGTTLGWTPTLADVGVATIKLKLSAGATECTQDLQLNVRQLFATLPFAPQDVRVSTDGKTLLILQYTPAPNFRMGYQPPNNEPYCRVALVSLTGPPGGRAASDAGLPSVIADRTLSSNIIQRVAALDDHYVYLPLQESDAFLVLSRKDLTDVRRIFAPGRVNGMASVTGNLYVACNVNNNMGQRQPQNTCFSVPALDPVALPADSTFNPFNNFNNGEITTVPVEADGGWLYNDILFDQTMTHPRLHVAPRNFIASSRIHGNNNAGAVYFDPYHRQLQLSTWGVLLQGTQIQRVSGQVVGQIAPRNQGYPFGMGMTPVVLLQDIPAAALLETTYRQTGNGINGMSTQLIASITFHDLQTAAAAGSVTLLDEPVDPQRQNQPSGAHLIASRGALIAVVHDRLFVVPLTGAGSPIDAAKLPVPLHFVNQQTYFAIGTDKPALLKHQIQGGTMPVEFTLASEAPGVELDKATGTLTLNGAALAASATDDAFQTLLARRGFVAPATQPSGYPGAMQPAPFETVLAAYRKEVAPRYTRLTGREPAGIPMAFTLGLIARDKNQQTAIFNEVIVLDLPTAPVIAKARAAEAEQKQQQAENEARMAAYARPAPQTQPDGDLQHRITDLERENAILRAKVEMLTDLLRGGQLGPTTRRSKGD